MRRVPRYFALLAAGALSCGQIEQPEPESEPLVVAIIGPDTIDVRAYDEMATKLLSSTHQGQDPASLDTRRQLLEAMFGRRLLAMEGQRRQLAALPRIEAALKRLEGELVWRALYDEVAASAGLDTAGIGVFIDEAGFSEEVLLQHIMLATEADAWGVIRALDAGVPMDVLAVERSTHHETGGLGGYFSYMPVAQVLAEVKEQILSLTPGQTYPAPLTSRYGIHVFRLLDRRPANVEKRWDIVLKEFRVHERWRFYGAFADSLTEANGLSCVSLSPDPGPTDPLCTWTGGQLLPADADLEEINAEDEPQKALRTRAREQLVVEEAIRRGMSDHPDVHEEIDARRDELMIAVLRREVVGAIELTDAEKRAYYEEHQELYGPRPSVRVDEVLVEDVILAQRIRGQAETGAPLDSLAQVHSIREETKKRGGTMWLVTRDNPLLGSLAPLALDADVGTLLGPLEVPGGYSVVRVAEKRQMPPRPYGEVERTISVILRLRTEHQRMDSLLAQLRVDFADDIVVHEDALKSVLTDFSDGEVDDVASN